MKAVSKGILWSLGALVALAIAGLVALNLYLQSPTAQAQIQEAIGDALGTPIEITNTHLTPWSDLRINGIRVPAAEGSSGTFAEAPSFTAKYRLLPLFSKQLVVTRMTLDAPKLAWRQNSEGRWVWPGSQKEEDPSEPREPKAKKKKKRRGERLEGKSKSGFEVLIEGLEVQNGTVDLQDAEGRPILTASEVNIDFSRLAAHDISGTLRIGKLAWSALRFEEMTTPFQIAEGTLDLSEIESQLAGGQVRGSFQMQIEDEELPMEMKLSLEGVDLNKIAAEAGWSDGSVSGRLRGSVDLKGSAKKIARAEGRGRLELEHGHFQQLEIFQTIGQVLAIDELTNLQLSEATADFRIADEKAFIEPLTLATPDLRLTGKGVARFDSKLSLDARLAVSEKLAKRLPGFVRDSFSDADAEKMRAIDFKVGGKITGPKTDLAEKLVGKKVGQEVQDLLSGLFGVKKKKEEKKDEKKDEKKKDDRKDKAQEEKKKDAEKTDKEPEPAVGENAPAPPGSPGASPSSNSTPTPAPASPPPAPASAPVPPPAASPATSAASATAPTFAISPAFASLFPHAPPGRARSSLPRATSSGSAPERWTSVLPPAPASVLSPTPASVP